MKKPIGTRIMGWMSLLLLGLGLWVVWVDSKIHIDRFEAVATACEWAFFWFCFLWWAIGTLVHRRRIYNARALASEFKRAGVGAGFSPEPAKRVPASSAPPQMAPAATSAEVKAKPQPRGVQTGPLGLK